MATGDGGGAAETPPGTINVTASKTQHAASNIAPARAPAAGSLASLAAMHAGGLGAPAGGRAGDDITRAAQEAGAAAALCRKGQFRAAIPLYALAVRLDPSNPEHHYYLACAAWKAEQSALVEPNLLDAVRLNPKHAAAQDTLAQWYVLHGETAKALEHSGAALGLDPHRLDFIISRGHALSAADEAQAAWDLISPRVTGGATDPQLVALYARLAVKLGQEGTAAPEVERILRTGESRATADGPAPQRAWLSFAAAALFERVGRYDEAFEQARLANESSRRPFDPAAHAAWVTRQIRYFTRDRMQSLPRASRLNRPAGARRPLLIVGMARSGTSLVEQILDSHPSVAGRGEIGLLPRIVGALDAAGHAEGESYPESVDSLSLRGATRLSAEYLSALEAGLPAQKAGAAYVTDKMPANVFGLGVAELLLPGSRVIYCTRDPLDTCVSCYFTGFAFGNEFTSDLRHLGAYHRDVRRIMDHWRTVLSLPILEVRYEDVVTDVEGQTRRMLDFLKLPWDDRCLRFFDNPRHVRTASSEQVRRPIYGSSVGKWRRYEKHLGPLIAALGTAQPH